MSRVGRGLVAAGILVGGAFAPVCAEAPSSLPRETWMGIYIGGAKIGYLRTILDRAIYQDRPGYKLDSFMQSRVVLLGTPIQQDVRTIVYTDEAFSPIYEEFEMSSGGRTTKITATFTEETVECEVISEGTTKKSIPIAEGARLVIDTMYGLEGKKITVGDKISMHYFNPLTLSIDEITCEALREEEIDIGDKKYNTLVIRYDTSLGELTCWQTQEGEVVKSIAMMGMTMLKESREKALEIEDSSGPEYTPPSDFAILTSVKADKDIKNPKSVRHLKLRLLGLKDKDLLINDTRQKAVLIQDNDPPAAEFTVRAKNFDARNSIAIGAHPDSMDQYLLDSPYIQVKDEIVVAKAAEIVKGTESAYEAASKIRQWLHKTMSPRANIGVPRSAADILKEPVGVCRDYATLFTALARAAGIPTRLVAGLVYMDGSFYYHAWVESYVGEWTPFDATLETDFVDATHVKFTEGDATSMFLMSRIIGTLEAEILEVR